MTDDLERRYAVTPMPTADEVLAGATQGGVPAPASFFTDDELATPEHASPLSVDEAFAAVQAATRALKDAQDAWYAAIARERGQ